jgi:hypothetical protein
MNEGTVEEMPFLSAMERRPEETLRAWRLDAERAKRCAVPANDAVHSAIKDVKTAMLNERGRDPDYDDTEDLIYRAAKAGAAAGAQYGGYREGPKESASRTVIISCTVALISAFMLGAWQVSMRVTAVETQVKNDADSQARWQAATDRRLDRLEARP